ncbi:hypothetical protein, partial [Mycobacterium sp.]|uniref:hypothetical protein n=1 Tax=Mycobacterium sp. TaxID=1785 RepID=UPI003F9EA131
WAWVGGVNDFVMPVALANDGVVLGYARDMSKAVICRPGGAWEPLGTAENWSPADINDAGDVVGFVKQEGMCRPWIRLATGQEIMLPYAIGHDTFPKAINSAGQIVGTAQADHGGHAVIWRRN